MSNVERPVKNEEVEIRRTYEFRVTTNKVSPACQSTRRGGQAGFLLLASESTWYLVLSTSYNS